MDEALVSELAKLSRLSIRDEERAELAGQLAKVLAAMQVLDSVDMEGVTPMQHPHDVSAPLAPDTQAGWADYRDALRAAPSFRDGGFAVPTVLED